MKQRMKLLGLLGILENESVAQTSLDFYAQFIPIFGCQSTI
jgi:hypothetical protein